MPYPDAVTETFSRAAARDTYSDAEAGEYVDPDDPEATWERLDDRGDRFRFVERKLAPYVLEEERRSGVYVSFLTFLRGLQFPTQFLTTATEFDAEPYLEQFVGPGAPNAPSGVADPVPTGDEDPTQEPTGDTEVDTARDVDAEPVSATDGGVTPSDTVADSPILEYGRIAHAGWLERALSVATVRDRRLPGRARGREASTRSR